MIARRSAALVVVLLMLLAAGLAGCEGRGGGQLGAPGGEAPADLTLLAGSENKTLEPILQRFAQQEHVNVKVDYLGSVDIMLRLQEGAAGYDGVWPANSLWIDLGDKGHLVKNQAGIMRSPVVFGVKKPVAQRLGWVGHDVTMEQILQAAEGGKLRFMMTSATQSNSGAGAFLGMLYAFSGRPEVLTPAHLKNPKVRDKVRRILGVVNRSAGSSGWLKDLFLQKSDQYDAMVNYEALVIETNQELVKQGKEPLYAVYPVDGLAVADSPLGYVNHGNADKEQKFLRLQKYLLSPEVQAQIQATGRRVGLAGLGAQSGDPALFNKEWGIDTARVLNPIRYPAPEVIREALDLYQTALRKPSLTAYCLDFSGSMKGEGRDGLVSAMRMLLDQDEARKLLLQASPDDVSLVIPFNHAPIDSWNVRGNNADELRGLWSKVNQVPADGGTDIYTPVVRALEAFQQQPSLARSFPAIILMTDGQSNQRANLNDVRQALARLHLPADVPIYSILFGDADERQLKELAQLTSGRVFDGRKDLIQAFREARGYN